MITLTQEACNACGICVKVCPHRVLAMLGGKAVLDAEERCIECAACQLNCREDAIVVTKGTALCVNVRETLRYLEIREEGNGGNP